jgi:(2Fe-2S) ferredoxin
MRAVSCPRLHLFVCANRREDSPLGPGCGARGDAVYDALKREVAERGAVSEVWVTKTHCLGVCPERGATIARYPGLHPVRADVTADEAASLLDEAFDPPVAWDAVEREIGAAEALQSKKVLELARRIKPGLTLEDIQNPHDFPELADPDWHYADGILSGIQSMATALRALRNRS